MPDATYSTAGTDEEAVDRPAGDPARTDEDILEEAREAFDLVVEAEDENRKTAKEDLHFARLSEQWPDDMLKKRQKAGRPCLSVPRMNAFIRQVVNDSRLNKTTINVHPADSVADPETAKIYDGLIRNIQYMSNADVAYDTAAEAAVSMGWGYFRIGVDFSHDDTFDLDINIQRVSNPFSIYGDPHSTAADSSDWNSAFVVEMVPKVRFEREYKGAKAVDWSGDYADLKPPWFEDASVMKAEWWCREETERKILQLSNGGIVDEAWFMAPDPETGVPRNEAFQMASVTPVRARTSKTWKVWQYILTGAEVLETNEWPGRYIPIVPVYGDEVDVEGKRYLRSLIHDAKDAQVLHNVWRSVSTELVALSPRVPFIGPKGSFRTDAIKWATVNTENHAYIEYDVVPGAPPPMRQPLDSGAALGAMQEALTASDDMKAIIGLYDASLGARSNETSGRAIMARQREGDVSTFHFVDNVSRAKRHAGRIIIDLIPYVYSGPRIVRVLGENRSHDAIPVNQPTPVLDKQGQPQMQPATGPDGQPVMGPDGQPQMQPMMRIYDLTAGKYDLIVSSGPSFTSRREEAATQMMELIRSFPAAAPIIGDLLAKALDWEGAEEIADRLKKMLPQVLQDGLPLEVQQMIEEGKKLIGKLQVENQDLQQQLGGKQADTKIKAFEAETGRLKVLEDAKVQFAGGITPEQIGEFVWKAVIEILHPGASQPAQQVPPMPFPPTSSSPMAQAA